MRVLVVEDERKTAAYLKKGLTENGFVVDTAETGEKEFSLLSLLARHAGEVMSRTLIAEQVWDMNFDSDTNVVDVHIRRLRSEEEVQLTETNIEP